MNSEMIYDYERWFGVTKPKVSAKTLRNRKKKKLGKKMRKKLRK